MPWRPSSKPRSNAMPRIREPELCYGFAVTTRPPKRRPASDRLFCAWLDLRARERGESPHAFAASRRDGNLAATAEADLIGLGDIANNRSCRGPRAVV